MGNAQTLGCAIQLQTVLIELSACKDQLWSSPAQYVSSQSDFYRHVQSPLSKPTIWGITSLDQTQIRNLPHFLIPQHNVEYQTLILTKIANNMIYFNSHFTMTKPHHTVYSKNTFQVNHAAR